jgi:ClpX C4-type zinc finger protein
MNRRYFVALIGAAIPGLWLDGSGLIQLPRRMVIDISGRCSFCSKYAREVFGLAGVTSRPTRVCNECIDICLEILRDDLLLNAPRPPLPERELLLNPEALLTGEDRLAKLLRRAQQPRSGAELQATLNHIRELLGTPAVQRADYGEQACSFCDRKMSALLVAARAQTS